MKSQHMFPFVKNDKKIMEVFTFTKSPALCIHVLLSVSSSVVILIRETNVGRVVTLAFSNFSLPYMLLVEY